MSQDFGMESHGRHVHGTWRAVSRYLVTIAAGDEPVARLFDAERRPLAEFDAATEEVSVMLRGLTPARTAGSVEWDAALGGHSERERADAQVYTLDL